MAIYHRLSRIWSANLASRGGQGASRDCVMIPFTLSFVVESHADIIFIDLSRRRTKLYSVGL
jgi:hypothetical protein